MNGSPTTAQETQPQAMTMADRCNIVRRRMQQGLVIPAHPLALTAERKLDERRQRALTRYYIEAGSGGLAVGVHTTQFAIRQPEIAMYPHVLQLAIQTAREYVQPPLMIAGVLGDTEQALAEATLAQHNGYDAVLLSLGGLGHRSEDELVAHCQRIGQILPVMGFYLQPAVGGIQLSYPFWRRFAEIESVIGIKIAPFNRYFTLDVVRAVVDSGRHRDISLYTGNDDTILHDLLTPFIFPNGNLQDDPLEVRIVGGLLGHWAVWTHSAFKLLKRVQAVTRVHAPIPADLLQLAYQITDSNAAFFDVANAYRGCISGLHEVLRRQGLLEGIWCVDPEECLSPGQSEEIDRVYQQYPHLNDDEFVAQHRDRWLS